MGIVVASLAVGCSPSWPEPHLSTGTQPNWEAPANRWVSERPPADLSGDAFEPGRVAPDLRLYDQFGDEVSLWQFYGHPVLIDVSIEQCAPCTELAQLLPDLEQAYADEGLVAVTVLQLDAYNDAPSTADLREWADAFSLDSPVLSDGARLMPAQGYPSTLLVDRSMVVALVALPPELDAVGRALDDLP